MTPTPNSSYEELREAIQRQHYSLAVNAYNSPQEHLPEYARSTTDDVIVLITLYTAEKVRQMLVQIDPYIDPEFREHFEQLACLTPDTKQNKEDTK